MSFNRNFESIIQKSDKSFININFDKDISVDFFNSYYEKLFSKKLFSGDFSFVDSYFDIDENDHIYGVINNKNNSLFLLRILKNELLSIPILDFNPNKYTFKFPVVKCINHSIHLFTYIISEGDESSCDLYHFYSSDGYFKKFNINNILTSILSNYVIFETENYIHLFYFKKYNSCEELYLSSFNLIDNTWSDAVKLTNSHKSKVYLSVLFFNDRYHICFAENYNNKFYCMYINLSINKNVVINNYSAISKTIACNFPTLISYKDVLYCQWIEYQNLYTCCSYDNGLTWSSPETDETINDNNIIRYNIKSNYLKNKNINLSNCFGKHGYPMPLGIKVD